jgi:hypothetical protein
MTSTPKNKAEEQADLTEALEESFPASDPPSMTQPKPAIGAPGDKKSASTGTEAELARQLAAEKDAGKK